MRAAAICTKVPKSQLWDLHPKKWWSRAKLITVCLNTKQSKISIPLIYQLRSVKLQLRSVWNQPGIFIPNIKNIHAVPKPCTRTLDVNRLDWKVTDYRNSSSLLSWRIIVQLFFFYYPYKKLSRLHRSLQIQHFKCDSQLTEPATEQDTSIYNTSLNTSSIIYSFTSHVTLWAVLAIFAAPVVAKLISLSLPHLLNQNSFDLEW